MKLTPTQFSRISQYIKMFEGDRETLQVAWGNTFDYYDYYDLTDNDTKRYITDLRDIVDCEKYSMREKKLLKECEMIYQQLILIKGKIVSK